MTAAPVTPPRAIRWHSRAAIRRTAIHEAGHAIVAEALGIGCAAISVASDYRKGTAGFALSKTGWDLVGIWDALGKWRGPDAELRAHAIQLLAGAAAERELLGHAGFGDDNDRREVRWLIRNMGYSDQSAERLSKRLERFTAGLVCRHRAAIAGLADMVLARRVMAGEVLADAMEQLLPTSPYLARHGAWARSDEAIAMAAEHGIAVARS